MKTCSHLLIYPLSCLIKVITLAALKFWILENDDVTCNPGIIRNLNLISVQSWAYLKFTPFVASLMSPWAWPEIKQQKLVKVPKRHCKSKESCPRMHQYCITPAWAIDPRPLCPFREDISWTLYEKKSTSDLSFLCCWKHAFYLCYCLHVNNRGESAIIGFHSSSQQIAFKLSSSQFIIFNLQFAVNRLSPCTQQVMSFS